MLGWSRYIGRIRICYEDPDIRGGSGYIERIRSWEDPDMLGGSGYVGISRISSCSRLVSPTNLTNCLFYTYVGELITSLSDLRLFRICLFAK